MPMDLRIINRAEDIEAGRDRVLEFALAFIQTFMFFFKLFVHNKILLIAEPFR